MTVQQVSIINTDVHEYPIFDTVKTDKKAV